MRKAPPPGATITDPDNEEIIHVQTLMDLLSADVYRSDKEARTIAQYFLKMMAQYIDSYGIYYIQEHSHGNDTTESMGVTGRADQSGNAPTAP